MGWLPYGPPLGLPGFLRITDPDDRRDRMIGETRAPKEERIEVRRE